MKITALKNTLLLLLSLGANFALSAQTYYVVPLADMGYTEEGIDEQNVSITRFARTHEQAIQFPEIQFDEVQAVAYIAFPEQEDDNRSWWGRENQSQLNVALRLPDKRPKRSKSARSQA